MYVWDCPNCGERLDDQIDYNVELIDCANDRVEHFNLCKTCHREVTQRMSTGSDGKPIPVMHQVDDERMEAFASEGFEDEEFAEEYEHDFIDYGDDDGY